MTEAEKVLSHAVQKAIDFLNKGDSEAARIYLVTASKMVKEIMDDGSRLEEAGRAFPAGRD